MEKKEIEKKELVLFSKYMLLFVALTASFAVVTLGLAIAIQSWVFETWGFITFFLPLYFIAVWRKEVVRFLRKEVEK